MKKIILYTTWNMNPAYGTGVAVAFGHIIEEMKKQHINFQLILNKFKYKTFTGFLFKRLLHNLLTSFNLRTLKPNVVLGLDFDGFLINKKNTRYILNLRSNFSEIKKHESGIMKLNCLIEEYAQKKATSKSDLIIVASRYTKKSVINNYDVSPEKVIIIPNGIDRKVFRTNKIHVPAENIILSVSALYPRKGISYLLKALKILKDRGIQFKHIHIGEGVMAPKINKLIKDLGLQKNIYMLGRISDRKKIAKIYNQCKVFCHPCLQEDFGNVFLEAMASGKPVIAFNNSSASEFIKQGKNGFLVPNKDIDKLANYIEILFNNSKLCYSMGQENLNLIKKYSWRKTAKQFISTIGQVSKNEM